MVKIELFHLILEYVYEGKNFYVVNIWENAQTILVLSVVFIKDS